LASLPAAGRDVIKRGKDGFSELNKEPNDLYRIKTLSKLKMNNRDTS
jgi:hypothetical protein